MESEFTDEQFRHLLDVILKNTILIEDLTSRLQELEARYREAIEMLEARNVG